jgi:RNA polymerase subunit RPABC4/transcription elongation factor Spt4
MNSAVKVSACVDCSMSLIGEQLRCPACHDRHAAKLIATPVEVTTQNRSSHSRWIVVTELLGVIALGLLLTARGCAS